MEFIITCDLLYRKDTYEDFELLKNNIRGLFLDEYDNLVDEGKIQINHKTMEHMYSIYICSGKYDLNVTLEELLKKSLELKIEIKIVNGKAYIKQDIGIIY